MPLVSYACADFCRPPPASQRDLSKKNLKTFSHTCEQIKIASLKRSPTQGTDSWRATFRETSERDGLLISQITAENNTVWVTRTQPTSSPEECSRNVAVHIQNGHIVKKRLYFRKNFRTAPYFIMHAHLINYAFYSLSLNTIDNSLGN